MSSASLGLYNLDLKIRHIYSVVCRAGCRELYWADTIYLGYKTFKLRWVEEPSTSFWMEVGALRRIFALFHAHAPVCKIAS